jgi:hypothetical protein
MVWAVLVTVAVARKERVDRACFFGRSYTSLHSLRLRFAFSESSMSAAILAASSQFQDVPGGVRRNTVAGLFLSD